MKDLADKIAFITGGSSGIGLGIAHASRTRDEGWIGYRTKQHLDAAMTWLASAGEMTANIGMS